MWKRVESAFLRVRLLPSGITRFWKKSDLILCREVVGENWQRAKQGRNAGKTNKLVQLCNTHESRLAVQVSVGDEPESIWQISLKRSYHWTRPGISDEACPVHLFLVAWFQPACIMVVWAHLFSSMQVSILKAATQKQKMKLAIFYEHTGKSRPDRDVFYKT